jgi:glycosyltransferase involved in cell wall biosynthesis
MKRLVSFVISAYNEELCIRELARRLREFMARHSRYDFEVIFVEHGSTDRTFELMSRVHEADPRFKIVQLSKNFGLVDYGYSAGMAYASGDAVVLMNADLQDPPDVVAKFLEKWEAGYDIVYGIILKREGVSLIRKIISPMFYWFMGKLTDGQMPKNATDFRLIDRKVYEQIRQMPEHNRFMRAMIAWTGFRQVGVPFVRASRFAQGSEGGGARDFNIFVFTYKTMRIISNAIYSFSDFPVKVMGAAGLISVLASVFAGLFYLAYFLVAGKAGPGYAAVLTPLLLVMFFLFGLLSSFLSWIGEYITRIYEETKMRPIFIVRKTIGFNIKKD